ncbi:MAG TPA: NAD(P)/FAD-dependent oxidoreductase, partial [Spirochaetota bacterium]|nr:NAD(P)/FAD-dependent oxidoreductase [Spirochaetota bacterium]
MGVVIIGAGVAGLAALHALRKAGVDAVCLEASDRAGGRVASLRRDGFILDTGAQFFFRYYDTCFGLCRELRLGGDIRSFPFRAGLPDLGPRNRVTPVLATIRPGTVPRTLLDLLRFRGVSLRSVRELLPLIPTLAARHRSLRFTRAADTLDLDTENLAEYTLRRCGTEALERIIQPVASCMTLGEPEELGAGYGMALFWYMINGLFTLRNGIGSISERLHEAHRDRVRFVTPVRRIVIEKNEVRGVETARGLIQADAVVCAVTATKALELMPGLPPSLAGPLRTARYSQGCHVMFGLEKRLLPRGWYAIALPRRSGSPMAGFTDSSIKSPAYAPEGAGLVHCFTYGKHAAEMMGMKDDAVVRALVADIRRYAPSMPDRPLFTEIC